jgi:pimeloyl-ACP methyl ester carboxylesterase
MRSTSQLRTPEAWSLPYGFEEAAMARWLKGVPEEKKAPLIPVGWFDQWADATWATDSDAAIRTPASIRAPNGAIYDIITYFSQGKPTWEPAKISVPTLLVVGEWDSDVLPTSEAIFSLLERAGNR